MWVGAAGALRGGWTRFTGAPSTQKPGPIGKLRLAPPRASSTTSPFSQRTTAPTKPEVGSSTTSPTLTGVSTDGRRRACCQPGASTSSE